MPHQLFSDEVDAEHDHKGGRGDILEIGFSFLPVLANCLHCEDDKRGGCDNEAEDENHAA
ncbi:MAG: hypothetical protein HY318_02845 [Armatimonadetes bacterium]|nr:hypothetical protein [Armatimonadota bacterium]